jgi:hypothetical protein
MWGANLTQGLRLPETGVLAKIPTKKYFGHKSLTLSDLKKSDVLKFA